MVKLCSTGFACAQLLRKALGSSALGQSFSEREAVGGVGWICVQSPDRCGQLVVVHVWYSYTFDCVCLRAVRVAIDNGGTLAVLN